MARRGCDSIVIGAGSPGCAVARGLATRPAGRVLVLDAGPSDIVPWVRMPVGLSRDGRRYARKQGDFAEVCVCRAKSGGSLCLRAPIRTSAGTAYHPVGTLRAGTDSAAPVTPGRGMRANNGLWVAGASIMPAVSSANTNAPSMMIGHRAGAPNAQKAAA